MNDQRTVPTGGWGDDPFERELRAILRDRAADSSLGRVYLRPESVSHALAVARGVVVRDYLLGRTVPVGRLFLGAAKALRNEGAWTPSAELLLDTR